MEEDDLNLVESGDTVVQGPIDPSPETWRRDAKDPEQLNECCWQIMDETRSIESVVGDLFARVDRLKKGVYGLWHHTNSDVERIVEYLRLSCAERHYTSDEMDLIMKTIKSPAGVVDGMGGDLDSVYMAKAKAEFGPERRILMDEVLRLASRQIRMSVPDLSLVCRVLPMEKAPNGSLVRSDDGGGLYVPWEREPDSPGSVGYIMCFDKGRRPVYVSTTRYNVHMARLMTPEFAIDSDWHAATGDKEPLCRKFDGESAAIASTLDDAFLGLVDEVVFDASKPATPESLDNLCQNRKTGKVQWMRVPGTYKGLSEASSMLPRPNPQGKFVCRNGSVGMSRKTAERLPDDVIDFLGQHVAGNGVYLFDDAEDKRLGNVYFFAHPEFLGKFLYVTDFSVYGHEDAYMDRFFSYFLGGFAIGNMAGVAVAQVEGMKEAANG